MYLTYDEYLTFGGTLDETAFDNLEFEARTVIDWWTYNRLQNEEEYPEAVKRCMYKLITIIAMKQQAQLLDGTNTSNINTTVNAGIIQQSNDGVSTTYNVMSAGEMITQSDETIKATVRMYLQNVRNSLGRKVLYRGLYPGE